MEIAQTTAGMPLPIDTNSLDAHSSKEEVAAAFESLFTSLLLKEMRKTLPEGLFGAENSDVLGGMFDQYMGQALAQGEGIGVRQLVMKHFDFEKIAQAREAQSEQPDQQ